MMFYHGNKRYVEPERLEQYYNQYKAEAKSEIDEKYPVQNDLVWIEWEWMMFCRFKILSIMLLIIILNITTW